MYGDIKYYRSGLRWWNFRISYLALVVFVNIPIAIIAMLLVVFTFHFKHEQTTTSHKLDMKGLMLFYLFVFFLMFTLMNNSQWYLNCLSFIIAIIMGMILIKMKRV